MKVKEQIESKLQHGFHPSHLEVTNESHRHRGDPNAETHFKVVVVSLAFEKRSLVDRHRELYRILSEEMAQGIHALALHPFTPKEWEQREGAQKSPACPSTPNSH